MGNYHCCKFNINTGDSNEGEFTIETKVNKYI